VINEKPGLKRPVKVYKGSKVEFKVLSVIQKTADVILIADLLSRFAVVYTKKTFSTVEDWELDFQWLHVRNLVKDTMRQETLPDLNMVLFLVGIHELGRWQKGYTKEEKQDLMHIGVCCLLAQEGYFEFIGRDQDGWPHYRQVLEMPAVNTLNQERLLKICAVKFFREWEKSAEPEGEVQT
jgi:hypothetical protein